MINFLDDILVKKAAGRKENAGPAPRSNATPPAPPTPDPDPDFDVDTIYDEINFEGLADMISNPDMIGELEGLVEALYGLEKGSISSGSDDPAPTEVKEGQNTTSISSKPSSKDDDNFDRAMEIFG